MTVAELIERLKNVDSKKDVYVRNSYGWVRTAKQIQVDSDGDVIIESI